MTLKSKIQEHTELPVSSQNSMPEKQEEAILCQHCQRTASNGIKCKGICVADSDY
jgi:hypothetical protein